MYIFSSVRKSIKFCIRCYATYTIIMTQNDIFINKRAIVLLSGNYFVMHFVLVMHFVQSTFHHLDVFIDNGL